MIDTEELLEEMLEKLLPAIESGKFAILFETNKVGFVFGTTKFIDDMANGSDTLTFNKYSNTPAEEFEDPESGTFH